MALAPYNFIVHHLPGKSNPADAPSRRPDYASVTQEINGLLPVLQKKLSLSEIALADGPTSASSTMQQEEPRDARMGPAAKENSGRRLITAYEPLDALIAQVTDPGSIQSGIPGAMPAERIRSVPNRAPRPITPPVVQEEPTSPLR